MTLQLQMKRVSLFYIILQKERTISFFGTNVCHLILDRALGQGTGKNQHINVLFLLGESNPNSMLLPGFSGIQLVLPFPCTLAKK